MDNLSALIAREEQAVALLKRKLSEREERLRVLRGMQSQDKFDALLQDELDALVQLSIDEFQGLTPPPTPQRVGVVIRRIRPKALQVGDGLDIREIATGLDERHRAVLQALADGNTKSLETVTTHLLQRQLINPGEEPKVRRIMFDMKNKFHMIDSPRRGCYRLKASPQEGGEDARAAHE
jgi:hypothetical protein